jgi:sugar phosphate permease
MAVKSTPSAAAATQATAVVESPTNVRYRVLVLTFLLAFIMYLDRVCMGVVSPTIMREFELDKITMGWSVSAFLWAYAIFQIPAGWMADRYGGRIVLAGALAWWSVFTAATGFSVGAISLAVTRFLFGAGEAAAFPASSRAVVRWLPAEQRAFGQGFQHSGSRLGAALTPPLVVLLAAAWGWRGMFVVFGAVGVLFAFVWYAYYRDFPQDHKSVNTAELKLLERAGVPKRSANVLSVPWRRILRSPDLWFLSCMYFCYGWVLWMYLNWYPTYLVEARGYTMAKVGIGASLPLLAATATNIAGGWISDILARRWGLKRGRLFVSVAGFSTAGLGLIPGVLAESPTVSMACLTLALAGLELTVPVSWALSLDIGGEFSGSVSAVMNTLGAVGGALSGICIGYLATNFGWRWPFLTASVMCGFAALLASRINPSRSAAAATKS